MADAKLAAGAPDAQATLKRLLEAEKQAEDILKAAELSAQKTMAQAREEAAQLVETARKEAEATSAKRLEEAKSRASAEVQHRIDAAQAQGSAMESRAKERLPKAVDMVVSWVTGGSE